MELRLAVPGDALAVGRIHARAWQAGYRGLLPAAYLDGLRAEDRAARYTFDRTDGPRTTVAVVDGAIVGFATIYGSELSALHVDPDAWSTGVGRALIARAEGFSSDGYKGFRRARRRKWLRKGGQNSETLAHA